MGMPVMGRMAPGLIPYRPDIDGLRGVAVLAVVFHHLGIGPGGGGFVGVDIFFVISGFLITAIVQAEIETGRFTFLRFYERRVRRIFPALVAVLLTTMLAGIWLLLPSDLVLLGKSAAATLAFASNLFFWRSSGYFDSESALNPLLHTWSLAVEEQFYIGLPILLLLVNVRCRRHLAATLTLLACASLAACLLVQPLQPSAVFYLSPFRAWELLAGGLLAIGAIPAIQRRLDREVISIVGMGLVAGGIIYITPGASFPGWQAIAPVLGTAALIHVGTGGGSVVTRLLRFPPLVYVGLISYSLYLWHWPLIVLAGYSNGLQPLDGWRWAVLAAALVAAALSYKFIEQPFRRRKTAVAPLRPFITAAAAGGLLGAISAMLVAGGGWPARFTPEVVAFDKERHPTIPFLRCDGNTKALGGSRGPCMLGTPARSPSILVWGDSHALAWAPAVDQLLDRYGTSGILAASSACPPLKDVKSIRNPDCHAHNKQVLEFLRQPQSPRTVILIASWFAYTEPGGFVAQQGAIYPSTHAAGFGEVLRQTVGHLQDAGKSVWIIGPTPGAPSAVPLRCAMAKRHGENCPAGIPTRVFKERSTRFYEAVAMLEQDDDLLVTDPAPWFCDDKACAFMKEGSLLYSDGGHLNKRGAAYLDPFLAPVIARVLQARIEGASSMHAPASGTPRTPRYGPAPETTKGPLSTMPASEPARIATCPAWVPTCGDIPKVAGCVPTPRC